MKVNEIFYSLQGEGFFTGQPAVFVRFSGCNRACSFCDTDFAAFTEMSADEIIAEIKKWNEGDRCFRSTHVVLTGGEPALQIDSAFVDRLKAAGCFVQIETNGSLPVPENIDWVTCSPKAKPWRIQRVDELKVVYEGQDVEAIASAFSPKVQCLQPCSGLNIPQTIDYILKHPHWRLSLQTHKLLNIR